VRSLPDRARVRAVRARDSEATIERQAVRARDLDANRRTADARAMTSRALARGFARSLDVVGVSGRALGRGRGSSGLGCAMRTGDERLVRAWSSGARTLDGARARAIALWRGANDGSRAYATALADRGVKSKRAGTYGLGDSIFKRDRDAEGGGRKGGSNAKAVVSAHEGEGDDDVSERMKRAGEMESAYDYMLPVRAYYVGSTIDVRALAKQLPAYPKEFNREGVIIRMSPKNVTDMPILDGDAPIPPDMLSRYLVVFKFGSVVFYNMGLREREECLKLARSFTSTPLAVPMTDDYRVAVRPTLADWASLENDHIVLKRMDINNISVISSVLAQTVALEHYEQKVDGMVEIFSKLNKSTELTGDLNISKKRLFSLVAENNNTLTELITKLGLLGRSDTAWQYAQYNMVWEGLRQDFELEDRFQDLDYKLNLIQTQVKFYLEILQNRKSDALEWIIIVLISLEICVSLYDMSDKIPSIPWPPF